MPIRPENRHRYPANWPDISRRIRFERAAGRCECLGECGRGTHAGRCPNRHGAPAYRTGSIVVLTTAHLDHIPEHCDDANLRAMCNGCHLRYDRAHHRQTAAATRRAAVEASGQLALSEGLMTKQQPADEVAPTYWFCNACGDEVDDEHSVCCDDGENEPSYDA